MKFRKDLNRPQRLIAGLLTLVMTFGLYSAHATIENAATADSVRNAIRSSLNRANIRFSDTLEICDKRSGQISNAAVQVESCILLIFDTPQDEYAALKRLGLRAFPEKVMNVWVHSSQDTIAPQPGISVGRSTPPRDYMGPVPYKRK